MLIKAGSKVTNCTAEGLTPLHLGAHQGSSDLITLLSKHGAKIDAVDRNKTNTPLMIAAGKGHVQATKALLAAGANVNFGIGDGDTPLHRACTGGSLEVVQLLLAAGADQDPLDHTHRTALVIAMQRSATDIVMLLQKSGSDPNDEVLWAAFSGELKRLKELLASGVSPSYATPSGWSPMLSAACGGQVAAAKLLHAAGASATASGGAAQRWPLMWACERGHTDFVRWALENQPDLKPQNSADNNVIHIAALQGNVGIVELLIAAAQTAQENLAALLSARNADRQTVWDIVESRRDEALLRLLQRATSAPADDAPAIIRAVAGGLLEHVLQLLQMASNISGNALISESIARMQ